MNQTFLLNFGIWYLIIAMLVLAIVSIKAYRASLKKVFVLFMIISIPTFADKMYGQLNLLMMRKFHNTIPNLITAREMRESPKYRLKSARYMQYEMKRNELSAEAYKRQAELENEYAEAIAQQKKRNWLKDIWNNIVWRLWSWLFPIAAIIICINEIKSSNQRLEPTRHDAR